MIMIIIAVVVVLILLWVISTYNKFVKLQNKVEEAFSTMDVYLKKRYDLIPNLVETIKGYTKHESETLERVISARNLAVNAQSLDCLLYTSFKKYFANQNIQLDWREGIENL